MSVSKAQSCLPRRPLFEQVWVVVWGESFAVPGTGGVCGSGCVLWTELCPPRTHVEALTPNVTISGDRVYRRYLRLKEERDHCLFPPSEDREVTIYEPGRQSSPGTESAGTLILDFLPPEAWVINVCWLSAQFVIFWYGSLSRLWHYVFFPREGCESSPYSEPHLGRPRAGEFSIRHPHG